MRIELHQNDPDLALSRPRAVGVLLPNPATAPQRCNACAAHDGKAWDHSAMMRALRKLAYFDIGRHAV